MNKTLKEVLAQEIARPLTADLVEAYLMRDGKNQAAVSLGRLGGKAGRGASKARKITSEQARKAALARWSKVNIEKKNQL